jgi:large subunit ribosomal protein L13
MKKTFSPKPGEVERAWYLVDAKGKTLGRLSTQIARVLTGKNKPQYATHVDTGDFVVVINAEHAVLTGRKEEQKIYYRHSGKPGNLKMETAGHLRERRPGQMIQRAVKGMLPKNKLGRRQIKKLKVYAGSEHPHSAQQPVAMEVA